MATQMHVIFSKTIMGAGLIAGPTFACALHNPMVAVTSCMLTPSFISTTTLETITSSGASIGNIDAVSNLANDRVFIFDGMADSVVNPAIGRKTAEYYQHFITDNNNIKTEFNINAEHGQPTNNYGAACDHLATSNFMNNCNYSAAYELLNFIYGGNLVRPSKDYVARGELKQFSQSDFFYVSLPSFYSMDTIGYVYVPTGCASKTNKCKLHVAFHGCKMGRSSIGDVYVRHAGYNEVGELNDIIILYPQVITEATNPQGCWDWFGYTGQLYATKNGFQPTALKRMIDKVTG